MEEKSQRSEPRALGLGQSSGLAGGCAFFVLTHGTARVTTLGSWGSIDSNGVAEGSVLLRGARCEHNEMFSLSPQKSAPQAFNQKHSSTRHALRVLLASELVCVVRASSVSAIVLDFSSVSICLPRSSNSLCGHPKH